MSTITLRRLEPLILEVESITTVLQNPNLKRVLSGIAPSLEKLRFAGPRFLVSFDVERVCGPV